MTTLWGHQHHAQLLLIKMKLIFSFINTQLGKWENSSIINDRHCVYFQWIWFPRKIQNDSAWVTLNQSLLIYEFNIIIKVYVLFVHEFKHLAEALLIYSCVNLYKSPSAHLKPVLVAETLWHYTGGDFLRNPADKQMFKWRKGCNYPKSV